MPQRMLSRFQRAKLRLLLPRLILGSIFVFSGLNGFFNFFTGPEFSLEGQRFMSTLRENGVWWNLLHTAELLGGSLLVFSTGQLAGILILAPVTAAIVAFHVFLSPQGAWLGLIAFALEAFLLLYWRENIIRIFRHKPHQPSAAFLARHPEAARR